MVVVLTLRLRSKQRHDVPMATLARHMSYVNFLLGMPRGWYGTGLSTAVAIGRT